MAATIARAQGYYRDGSPQNKEATRLGNGLAEAQANTWKTFTKCSIDAKGSGYIRVGRGSRSFTYTFGPELEELEVTHV